MRPALEPGSRLIRRSAELCFHCAPGPIQDPLTRAHVRLLGPCFKTGRVGDRPTRRKPPASNAPDAANGRVSAREPTRSECGNPRPPPATFRRDFREEEAIRPAKGLSTPRSGDEPLTGRLTTGDAHEARHRPPAISRPSGRHACAPEPAAASFGRETNASGAAETQSQTAPLREALLDFPTRRPPLQTESSRHRISRAHPFTSEQFHVLLNSLFKVLCNFPSRYLFAIGLTAVFSLRWSLPPD